jgi:DNA-binding response OmpR family regulator
MRVLLVDDEEELVSTLAERLDLRGIESDWVTNGEEGLRLAMANDYDWIVLDMKMPGIGGLQTMQAIKRRRPETRIIVVTGHSSVQDRESGMQAGATHYLLKPVEVEDLIALMQGSSNAEGRT